MRVAGLVGRRGEEVALVALVAEAPQLLRRIAVIEEVLGEVAHMTEGLVARVRVRRVVVAVEKDDRHPPDPPDARPEPDDGLVQCGVLGDAEAAGERRADGLLGVEPVSEPGRVERRAVA